MSDSLIGRVLSRFQWSIGERTLVDTRLEEFPRFVQAIHRTGQDRVQVEHIPLINELVFSSDRRFAANAAEYWVLDPFLHMLHHISFEHADRAAVEERTVNDSLLLPAFSLPIGRSGTMNEDRSEVSAIMPLGRTGDSLLLLGRLKTPIAKAGDERTVLRRFTARYATGKITDPLLFSLDDTTMPGVLPMTEASKVRFTSAGDLMCQVTRMDRPGERPFDAHPLFAYFTAKDGEWILDSVPSQSYPELLWDHGYRYQYFSGHFSAERFIFGSFPLLVNTTEWSQREIAHDLDLDLDSCFALVPGYFITGGLCDGEGMTSILYMHDDAWYLARFLTSNWTLIDRSVLPTDQILPYSLKLIDHNTLVGLRTDRKAIVRLRFTEP